MGSGYPHPLKRNTENLIFLYSLDIVTANWFLASTPLADVANKKEKIC